MAGNALRKRLTVILNVVIKVLEDEKDEGLVATLDEALRVGRALAIYFPSSVRNQTSVRLCAAWTECDS